MFTGLIEEVGVVKRLERRAEGGRLHVEASKVLEDTKIGDSIAVNGACLTVVEMGPRHFVVDCMPETLTRTTIGAAVSGTRVNLERAMAVGGRLGGHLVLGHVDAVARVLSVTRESNSILIQLGLPEGISSCVAPKGSIAIDGISLTVVDVEEGTFSVGIIPHTLGETTLKYAAPGSSVNLEADVLARYVLRTLQALAGQPGSSGHSGAKRAEGGLTADFLRDQGFI